MSGSQTAGAPFMGLFVLAFCFAMPVSAELSQVESRIAEVAKQQKDPAVALLEEVVNINSGTMNLAGVKAVGKVFQRELDALGFDTVWHDMSAVNHWAICSQPLDRATSSIIDRTPRYRFRTIKRLSAVSSHGRRGNRPRSERHEGGRCGHGLCTESAERGRGARSGQVHRGAYR